MALAASAFAAEAPPADRKSGYDFMSRETRAMQDDDTANPGLLWVLEGETLWSRKAGGAGRSCADCHGDARTSMKGVAARHPAFGVPYTRLGYRPMRELIALLRAREFDIYICSPGSRDFVRVFSEDMYDIPRQAVIGSGTALEYRHGKVYRTKGVEQPADDGPGKPVHIWTRTGRKPLLAGGNADGDAAMLRTARFGLLIRHDDAGREFAYDAGAEKALAKAKERGWTVVSMQNDFKVVFDL
jgi:hypothetical protein